MKIWSPAFTDGGPIPRAHTCDGADLSPPLAWTEIPDSTAQLMLIATDEQGDPDEAAVHWVLYGLAPNNATLPAGLPREPRIAHPFPITQGVNSAHGIGYRGPCPSAGSTHRLVFTLYALNRAISLPPGASSTLVSRASRDHIVEEARTTGTYAR